MLNKVALAVSGAVLVASAAGCNPDSLTNLNKNPNAPEKVDPAKIFPSGVTASVGLIEGASMQLYFTELWAQHLAEYQYPDDDQYVIRPTTIDAYWASFYSGGLQDLEQVLRDAATAKDPDMAGPALVMKSWTFQSATDLWGDIPYSQANKGDLGNTSPAYDPQATIYGGILTDLKTAASTMSSTNPFGAADLIYGGDNDKWARFANSLRARVALRLAKVDPAKAASEIQAVAAGGFASNADNAMLAWPGDGVNNSPYYNTFLTRDDFRMSMTLIDTLISYNDPRLPIFAQPTQNWQADSTSGVPKYAGLRNGLTATAAGLQGRSTSRIGTYFMEPDMPSMLMTYAEFSFIKAEAAERGWIPGSAASFYYDGITASMEQYGVSAADIATYIAQPKVAYVPGAAGLAQIQLQKWIALFGQGLEAWAEYRRTGVPNLTPADQAQTTPAIVPRRLEYPISEQSFNNANLQAAIARQGGATMTNRIYWDKP